MNLIDMATQMDSRPIKVSIIVPMRNEELRVGACLDSILGGDFPMGDCEILIVDGASTDRSCEIVKERMSGCPKLRLLHNPHRHVPAGLNIAIRQAQGEFILRMDAHCEYPPDYVRNCVSELERTGAANVGGALQTLPGSDTWIARSIALLTQHPIGVGNSAFRLGKGDLFVDTVPFGAFRREIFDQVGLFREDLVRNQDFEFNARIRSAGFGIYLSSKITNRYYNSPDFASFVRQAISNGVWGARCWLRYPASFCWRHAAPFAFVSTELLLLLLGLAYRPFAVLAASIALIYACALLYAGAEISLRNNWRYFFLVPGLIAAYHLCYGAATAWGFMDSFIQARSRRLARFQDWCIRVERAFRPASRLDLRSSGFQPTAQQWAESLTEKNGVDAALKRRSTRTGRIQQSGKDPNLSADVH
jgi:succinoglycan biosynthesis protein ExoA